jgi:hypothetical protein
LLDTVFTGNGSSTWHAIEYGLDLLKKGMIWRIGSGATVRIWRDPWIPGTINHRPTTPKGRCRYRWVTDLLTPDGQCNEGKLAQFFSEQDVVEILKIKPSSRHEADFLAWFPDKRGNFSIKSPYRLALDNQMMQQDRGQQAYTLQAVADTEFFRILGAL